MTLVVCSNFAVPVVIFVVYIFQLRDGEADCCGVRQMVGIEIVTDYVIGKHKAKVGI